MKVCVTGATGFIGGWVVKLFLSEGHEVHATVRDPSSPKCNFLRDMAAAHEENNNGKLILFSADLTKPGSFDEALQGCEVLVHVALQIDLSEKIIDPMLAAIRHLVDSCKKAGVRRIVHTSSTSTIHKLEKYRAADRKSSLIREDEVAAHFSRKWNPYGYCKILCDDLLEELWKGELMAVAPSMVIGPQQNDQITSSQTLLSKMARNELPLLPPFYLDCVDVRDVAAAHVFAATKEGLASGRYSVAGSNCLSTKALAAGLNAADKSLKLWTLMMGWWLLWIVSWFDWRIDPWFVWELTFPFPGFSTEKIRAAGFKFQYTSPTMQQTLSDALQSFKQFGIVTPKKPKAL